MDDLATQNEQQRVWQLDQSLTRNRLALSPVNKVEKLERKLEGLAALPPIIRDPRTTLLLQWFVLQGVQPQWGQRELFTVNGALAAIEAEVAQLEEQRAGACKALEQALAGVETFLSTLATS